MTHATTRKKYVQRGSATKRIVPSAPSTAPPAAMAHGVHATTTTVPRRAIATPTTLVGAMRGTRTAIHTASRAEPVARNTVNHSVDTARRAYLGRADRST